MAAKKKTTEKKRPRGRPAYKPTDSDRSKVKTLAGYGLTHDHIATVMEISDETLRKHYRKELDAGMATAQAQIASWAFDSARSGSVPMRIFLCKTQLGWKETVHTEHSGEIKGLYEVITSESESS